MTISCESCWTLFERGLSHRGLPLKRKFRPRCCAKTRAGVPCIMRVVPGKRRCRFHGGVKNEAWARPDRRSTATALGFGHAKIGLCHHFGGRPPDARKNGKAACGGRG